MKQMIRMDKFWCGKCGKEYSRISDTVKCCIDKNILEKIKADRRNIEERKEQEQIIKQVREIKIKETQVVFKRNERQNDLEDYSKL